MVQALGGSVPDTKQTDYCGANIIAASNANPGGPKDYHTCRLRKHGPEVLHQCWVSGCTLTWSDDGKTSTS